jgi:hypothetical protein
VVRPLFVFRMNKKETCKYERTTYKKKIEQETTTVKEDGAQCPGTGCVSQWCAFGSFLGGGGGGRKVPARDMRVKGGVE